MSATSQGRMARPKCSFEVYRSEGDSMYMQQKYERAISCYTQALHRKENDAHCLLRRSACFSLLGNIDNALKDVDEALSFAPDSYKCLLQKAEVLYCKGEFEFALIFFQRGYKKRPEITSFRKGIQKCEEAIKNSLACKKLGNKTTEKHSATGDYSESEKPASKKKPKSEADEAKENYPMHILSSGQSRKTFGFLHNDHEYLKDLMKEDKAKYKPEMSEEICQIARSGLDYLDKRAQFWFEEKSICPKPRLKTNREGGWSRQKQSRLLIMVLDRMHEIDHYQQSEEHVIASKLAEELRQEVEKWPADELPDRSEILANVYSLLGLSQLELDQLDEALHSLTTAQELGQKHNLPDVLSHSADNIGRVHAKKGEYDAAIEVWQKKLDQCEDPEELIWLRYEIGRCHLEMERSEEALTQADQAKLLAEEAEDKKWLLNLNVLIGQANLQLDQRNEARRAFKCARILADDLNSEDACKAISRVLEEMDTEQCETTEEANPETTEDIEERKSDEELVKPSENIEEKTTSPDTSES